MQKKGLEKREFKRGPLQIPVKYSINHTLRDGYMTNLSVGGCLLYCYSLFSIRAGEQVEISFNLKNSQDKISLKGEILRVDPFVYNPDYASREEINQALGVKFLILNEVQKQAIEGYTSMVLDRMNIRNPDENRDQK